MKNSVGSTNPPGTGDEQTEEEQNIQEVLSATVLLRVSCFGVAVVFRIVRRCCGDEDGEVLTSLVNIIDSKYIIR